MAIEFNCQGCQKKLRVPDEFSGRKAKCPNCQTILQVPANNETVSPLEVQPPIGPSMSDPFAGLDSIDSSPSNSGRSPVPGRRSSNPYSSPQPVQQSSQPGRRRSGGAPHRGGLVLGLGIGAMVCNFCLIPGILALVFGLADLKAMKAGRMDNEGYGLTMAGTVMGGILTAMWVLILMVYVFIFLVVIIAGP